MDDDLILDNICDRVKPLVFAGNEKVHKLTLTIYKRKKEKNVAHAVWRKRLKTNSPDNFLFFTKTDNKRRRPSTTNSIHSSRMHKEKPKLR